MPDLTQVISLYFLFTFLSIYLFVYCFKVPDYISSYYAYVKFERKCHSHEYSFLPSSEQGIRQSLL